MKSTVEKTLVAEVVSEEAPVDPMQSAKRALNAEDESASYCCEAAGTIAADDLPAEDAF